MWQCVCTSQRRGKALYCFVTQHYTTQVSGNQWKPEAIAYYNKTKSAVDIMDKMLGEYTTKRTTRRWPFAFFFNILDVAALAAYIIYAANNGLNTLNAKKHSARRTFLLDLGNQLAMPAVLQRSSNPNVCGNFKKRIALESVLG